MPAASPQVTPPSVLIVGAGRLGTVLGAALQHAGWPVTIVARGDASAARAAARELQVIRSVDAARDAALVLLCVPDDAVRAAAAAVAASPRALAPGGIALHTSGAAPVTTLACLEARAGGTGSLHPLQVVTGASESDVLRGAPAAISGNPEALRMAARVAEAVGLVPFALTDDAKPLYHAASSMAANFTVGLLDAAIRVATASGMSGTEARRACVALARAAVDRVEELGTEAALTGPIVRGDAGTVRAHLAALHQQLPELVPLYVHDARQTLALAQRAGLDPVAAGRIASALDPQDNR